MRKLIVLAAVLAVTAFPAMAQYDPSPMEVYGGISYLNPDGLSGTAVGGYGEFALNISEKSSIVFEVGVQKDTIPLTVLDPTGFPVTQDFKFTFATVQTGFRYYLVRNERFSVFGHLLTGGFFLSAFGFDSNSGAFTPGGGVEINLNRRIAIRPVQADLVLASSGFGGSQSHFRYGGGIVYRFGE